MATLPAGTGTIKFTFKGFASLFGNSLTSRMPPRAVLTCDETEMVLVLPVSSITNINLDELQLNSPSCQINYNTTHLVARISLNGCGTKIVVKIVFFSYFVVVTNQGEASVSLCDITMNLFSEL